MTWNETRIFPKKVDYPLTLGQIYCAKLTIRGVNYVLVIFRKCGVFYKKIASKELLNGWYILELK